MIAVLRNGTTGVCLDGRWKGWLMRRHPDRGWVTDRKLEQIDPKDDLPDWMRPENKEVESKP